MLSQHVLRSMLGIPDLPEAPDRKLTGLEILNALWQSKYHFFMEENSENLLAPSEGALGSQITLFFLPSSNTE